MTPLSATWQEKAELEKISAEIKEMFKQDDMAHAVDTLARVISEKCAQHVKINGNAMHPLQAKIEKATSICTELKNIGILSEEFLSIIERKVGVQILKESTNSPCASNFDV